VSSVLRLISVSIRRERQRACHFPEAPFRGLNLGYPTIRSEYVPQMRGWGVYGELAPDASHDLCSAV
jgi:hypothetical protein